jgi:hypothetical protein
MNSARPRLGGSPLSADHDALIRTAKQLMAMRIALLHTMETLRRETEKCLDDGKARMVRTFHHVISPGVKSDPHWVMTRNMYPFGEDRLFKRLPRGCPQCVTPSHSTQ